MRNCVSSKLVYFALLTVYHLKIVASGLIFQNR